MDEDIRSALTDIKNSVRDGFRDTNKRIDDLVTRGEFTATIARLDAQHGTLRRDFDTHTQKSDLVLKKIEDDDAETLRQALARTENVEKKVESELTEYRTTTRWAIGLTATLAASLVALIQWLVPLI